MILLSGVIAWKLKPEKEHVPPPPALVTVQEMGVLTSLKVNYANIIEFNKRVTQEIPWTQWELRFGGTRVILVARGDCLIGTDLKLARYEKVSFQDKTASLVVPHPKIISARLNHDPKSGGSYFYEMTNSGVVALVPGTEGQTKAMNLALQKGQSEIQTNCGKSELIESARKSAEAVLLPTVSATGWKVGIVWQ
ncbi:DUF4230 domain-containing protein [Paucibacter sp. B2R-40]|uniref:DUF4230 domain-containing protein n=1 Tax=Paucibacter sp. B2R-40 TaxID=2893554 RepID=UPI0021E4D0EB|nr:DUF4230 domain-containing protein [Paucibacter sp. B2R-40]